MKWLPDHIQHAYKIWAQSDQWFPRYKTKGDLNFDLHLHSQDGLISTWCYYVIWLADHIAYAYKIWTQSEQWLLRYSTKRDLNFDLHLHNQDGVSSTWCYYIIWLADHITYAYQLGIHRPCGFWDTKQRGNVCGRMCVCVFHVRISLLVTCGLLLIEHLTIVTDWFQITFSIQNLTMFPTSDSKIRDHITDSPDSTATTY